jgi:hypothetical protein
MRQLKPLCPVDDARAYIHMADSSDMLATAFERLQE